MSQSRHASTVSPSPSLSHAAASHDANSRAKAGGEGEPESSLATDAGRVAVASSVASALTKSLLHPLDTLKCRVQIYSSSAAARASPQSFASDGRTRGPGARAVDAVAAPAQRTRTVWREIRQQYAGKWGPRYLYGGLPVKLLFYMPYQACYMTSYNATRSVLAERYEYSHAQPSGKPGSSSSSPSSSSPSDAVVFSTVSSAAAAGPRALLPCTIAAALVAELSSCVVRVPMEILKMRIQSTVADGTYDALRQLRRNGLRTCARLVVPQTLLHDIPYSVTQWVAYEALRPRWEGNTGAAEDRQPADDGLLCKYHEALVRTFFSGGFSGLIAATLTLPLDNLRTRMVVGTAANPQLRVGDVVRAAYRADGLRSFFRGGAMRVLWVTTNMACYFPLFELCRAAMQKDNR